MKKIINFIVEKRYIVLTLMLILTGAMMFCAPFVKVNFDMTLYLADNSNMKQGLEILQDNFPAASQSQSIRVMFKGLDENQKQQVKKDLETIVKDVGKDSEDSLNFGMVTHDNSENFNSGEYSLFMINTSAPYGSKEIKEIEKRLSTDFTSYDMCFVSDDPNYEIPPWVMITAVSAVVIILFLMCSSWFEPLLFLLVIGLAVITNFGSNIILGTISSVTASIAAILQLALSIDYSIILMNRYRQERAHIEDKKEAMKKALKGSVISILSSSLTTIVGLLALVLMNFKIGADLGIVLAKGVFISLLYVLTILPCLIIASDKIIFKSTKSVIHENFIKKREERRTKKGIVYKRVRPIKKHKTFSGLMANFTFKWRNIIMCVFIALFVALYFVQGTTPITFSLEEDDEIKQVFTPQNMVVLVYDTKDEEQAPEVIKKISEGKENSVVLNYFEIVEKKRTSKEMVDNLSGFTSGIAIPQSVVDAIYYNKKDGKIYPAKTAEICNLVYNLAGTDHSVVPVNDELKKYIQILGNISNKDEIHIEKKPSEMEEVFKGLANENGKIEFNGKEFDLKVAISGIYFIKGKSTMSIYDFSSALALIEPKAKPLETIVKSVDEDKDLTAEEMYNMFKKLDDSIKKDYIDALYIINSSIGRCDPEWKMSLDEIINYAIELSQNPPFSSLISDDILGYLKEAKNMLSYAGSQLKNDDYSLMIINNTLPQEGKETFDFFDNVTKACNENFENKYYMVGMSYMNYEMHNNFGRELNIITLATVLVIFLVVALSFKNLIIPLILVCIVQCGVFLTVTSMHFTGVYFLALLIVECILMGATIDYGILFTNYYRENRKYTSIKKSIKNSYKHSIHTIMTSGLILILATGLIGVFDRSTISQICIAISLGALSAVLLILFVLPSLLIVFDKLVMGKNKGNRKRGSGKKEWQTPQIANGNENITLKTVSELTTTLNVDSSLKEDNEEKTKENEVFKEKDEENSLKEEISENKENEIFEKEEKEISEKEQTFKGKKKVAKHLKRVVINFKDKNNTK